MTLLSRLVLPTRTKGPFYPGWCYQPGQKASPRDSSKGSYSILSHVYYLGELATKPCVEQEVLGSNPVVSKKNFNVRHLLSRFFHPGQKPREAFVPEALSRFQNRDKSQFGTGTKGQICSSVSLVAARGHVMAQYQRLCMPSRRVRASCMDRDRPGSCCHI